MRLLSFRLLVVFGVLFSATAFAQKYSNPYISKISGSEYFSIAHVVTYLGNHELYLIENDFTRNPYEEILDPYTLRRNNRTWHLKPFMVKRNGAEKRYFALYNTTSLTYMLSERLGFVSSSQFEKNMKRRSDGSFENPKAAEQLLFEIVPRGDGTISILDFHGNQVAARGRSGKQGASRFLLILVD